MSDSILQSTKKALDVPEDYDVFDANIIMHINSVFSTLNQLGIGPIDGYEITDASDTWTDYLKGNARLNCVKTYMAQRVRLLFDPPATSFLLDAIKSQIAELEWRIMCEKETESTLLVGEHKRITGHAGDEYRIRLTNPTGQTLINDSGIYEADFTSSDGSRTRDAALDVSQRADGVLFLSVVVANGTYTVRRTNPRRTVLILDTRVQ